MPLVGSHPGWYNLRLQYLDRKGRLHMKRYHWEKAWQDDIAYTKRKGNLMGDYVKAWRVPLPDPNQQHEEEEKG